MKRFALIGQRGIPADFPGTSGLEFYVQNLAVKLAKENKVVCYVRQWNKINKSKKFKNVLLQPIPSINTKHLDTITYSFISTLHACFSDSKIIWYQAIGSAFWSFLPALFNKKVYTTIHGLDWKREKWNRLAKAFLKVCERMAVLQSEKLFVVSLELKKYFKNNYGVSVEYLPPNIKAGKKLLPNIILKKYHLKDNGFILFLGRFVPEKRIDWIVKAFNKFKTSRLKLVLAGGPSHSEKYTNYLHNITKTNKNIIFTGYVFGEEKDELLSNCTIFVLPSSTEGSSLSLMEAIKMHKRCLVSDLEVNTELSKIYKSITTFDKNNYQHFYKEMKRLLSNKSLH